MVHWLSSPVPHLSIFLFLCSSISPALATDCWITTDAGSHCYSIPDGNLTNAGDSAQDPIVLIEQKFVGAKFRRQDAKVAASDHCVPCPAAKNTSSASLEQPAVSVSSLPLQDDAQETQSASNEISSTATTSPESLITPPPTTPPLVCELYSEDPGQGRNQAYCLCDSSTTLSPITSLPATAVQSDSCVFSTMPISATEVVSTLARTFTSACQVCTQVAMNQPTCTSTVAGCTTSAPPSKPTHVVNLSKLPVHVGDITKNDGKDFRTNMMKTLQAMCPDPPAGGKGTCTSDQTTMDQKFWTVVGGGTIQGQVTFQFEDSSYDSPEERDTMLALATAAFQQLAAQNCENTTYQYDADPTQSGCHPPALDKRMGFRGLDSPHGQALDRRTPINEMGTPRVMTCHAQLPICNGPDHINIELAGKTGAYANSLDLRMTFVLAGISGMNSFICQMLIEGLGALIMVVAPEMAPAMALAGSSVDALCGN